MWEKALGLVVSVGVTLASLKLLLHIASKDDLAADYSLHVNLRLGLLAFLSGELVFWCGFRPFSGGEGKGLLGSYDVLFLGEVLRGSAEPLQGALFQKLLVCAVLGILAGCLLMACVTDCQNCMVYHYVWWVGGAASIFLLGFSWLGMFWKEPSCREPLCPDCNYDCLKLVVRAAAERLFPVLLFALLQKKLFFRMYGRADCHAFTVCAAAECGIGLGMKEYLVHMLLAFLLLGVVQGLQGNIGRKGNLKEDVAFLPYITISFWGLLLMAGKTRGFP